MKMIFQDVFPASGYFMMNGVIVVIVGFRGLNRNTENEPEWKQRVDQSSVTVCVHTLCTDSAHEGCVCFWSQSRMKGKTWTR